MLILFDSGSRIDIYKLLKETPHALVLALLSFIFSFSFVFLSLIYVFAFQVQQALVLSAITAGTSSAIVSPLMDLMKNLKKELSLILKIESVLTDPLVIIVAIVFLRTSSLVLVDPHAVITDVLQMLSTSIVLGFCAGVAWGFVWHKFERFEFHYMLTLAFLFLMFVLSNFLGGNGAISVFVVGLVLGNMRKIKQMFKLEHVYKGISKDIRQLNSYLTFFIKTFFFSVMGMSAEISEPAPVCIALFIAFILFLARAASVGLFSLVHRLEKREKLLISFLYPRGLAAAVLASVVSERFGSSNLITQIVFGVIVFTVIISTMGIALYEKKQR